MYTVAASGRLHGMGGSWRNFPTVDLYGIVIYIEERIVTSANNIIIYTSAFYTVYFVDGVKRIINHVDFDIGFASVISEV